MTATPTSEAGSSRMLSRRAMLQGAAGLGAVAIGGLGPTAAPIASAVQIDTTAPDLGAPTGPAPETLLGVATRLNFDQAGIVAFVREEIAYEPYAGSLRGPLGTLWARAGNSIDQTMLLGALLDLAQIPYRLALGSLEPEARTDLDGIARTDAARVQDTFNRKMAAIYQSVSETVPATSSAPDANAQAALDSIAGSTPAIDDAATQAHDRMASVLGAALDRAGLEIPPPTDVVPAAEYERHAWLQLPDGPDWVDVDPVFPETGSPLASASDFPETIPPDLVHTVRVRIVVEEVVGGKLRRRDGAVREFTSDQLINLPVSFMVSPSDALANLGQSIARPFSGQLTYNPIIVLGSDAELGTTSIVFKSSEETLFGLFDGATPADSTLPGEGEVVALWYAVDVTSPGSDPVTVERPWFDRLGADARLQSEPDLSRLAPLETYTATDGSTMVRGLDRVSMLGFDVARLPSAITLWNHRLNDTFANTNTLGPSYSSLRESLGLLLEQERGYATAVTSPQVTAFTFEPSAPDSGSSEIRVTADLLVHTPGVIPFEDAPSTAPHPAISAGIIDQVAEHLVLEPGPWSDGIPSDQQAAPNPAPIHIGAILDAAEAQDIPFSVVTSGDQLNASPTSAASIQAALDAGFIVIAPEQPVDIEGSMRLGWWVIDPVSGRTRDEMDSGGGSVATWIPGRSLAAFGPLADYLLAIRYWWSILDGAKCFYTVAKLAFALYGISKISDPDSQGIAIGAWYAFGVFDVATSCALL